MTVLQVSYGIGAIVVVGLLIGFWIVRRRITRRRPRQGVLRPPSVGGAGPAGSLERCDADPPERITMIVRQTGAVLTAMARTIAQERDKLDVLAAGMALPSTGEAAAEGHGDLPNDVHERILPLAGSGETVSAIAHRLELPEAEVSLVIRLNAV